MDRLNNSPKAPLTSAPDRRLLGRSTIAALVLIAAAGLVVTALFVSNAGRAGHSPGVTPSRRSSCAANPCASSAAAPGITTTRCTERLCFSKG
jgi:hypothetical protein